MKQTKFTAQTLSTRLAWDADGLYALAADVIGAKGNGLRKSGIDVMQLSKAIERAATELLKASEELDKR